MSTPRPIQTFYDGRFFRSRLEARWAVVFKTLGVPYEYEPEGFDLGGINYLPDFRVKCYGKRGDYESEPFDLYIEVKGQMTAEDAEKIRRFCAFREQGEGLIEIPDNPLLIVHTIPNDGCATDYAMSEYNMGFDIYPFNYETIDGDWFPAYPAATDDGRFYLFGGDSSYINEKDELRMEYAYMAARCARFEHGETPQTIKQHFIGQHPCVRRRL